MAATALDTDRIADCTAGDACPTCGGDVVNVQGILVCAACGQHSA